MKGKDPMPLVDGIPLIIGDYLNMGMIGHGAFGQVHLLTDSNRDRYACKVYYRKHFKHNEIRKRSEREIRIMKTLNHPNVVKVRNVVYTEDSICVVMDYYPNDLFHVLNNSERLDALAVYCIFTQILEGIKYLHGRGIAHRDIKPENILVAGNVQEVETLKVKITDFGLCHEIRDGQRLSTPCGSPLYAAPEILNGDDYDGEKCDIWSLGVVLFAMATSHLPWDDDASQNEILKQIKSGVYTIPEFVPRMLKDLIAKMLAPESERATLQEIANHEWMREMERRKIKHQILQKEKEMEMEKKMQMQMEQEQQNPSDQVSLLPVVRKSILIRPDVNRGSRGRSNIQNPVTVLFPPKRNSCPRVEPLRYPAEITRSMVLPPYVPSEEARRRSCV